MRKRKQTSSAALMIRMIDVVFILLFGFVAVSQITQAEAIEPPKSAEVSRVAPEGPDIAIVGLRGDGAFSVSGGAMLLKNERELAGWLGERAARARENGTDFRVRIRANWDSKLDAALRVARLCRDKGYAKGIDVVRIKE